MRRIGVLLVPLDIRKCIGYSDNNGLFLSSFPFRRSSLC